MCSQYWLSLTIWQVIHFGSNLSVYHQMTERLEPPSVRWIPPAPHTHWLETCPCHHESVQPFAIFKFLVPIWGFHLWPRLVGISQDRWEPLFNWISARETYPCHHESVPTLLSSFNLWRPGSIIMMRDTSSLCHHPDHRATIIQFSPKFSQNCATSQFLMHFHINSQLYSDKMCSW